MIMMVAQLKQYELKGFILICQIFILPRLLSILIGNYREKSFIKYDKWPQRLMSILVYNYK